MPNLKYTVKSNLHIQIQTLLPLLSHIRKKTLAHTTMCHNTQLHSTKVILITFLKNKPCTSKKSLLFRSCSCSLGDLIESLLCLSINVVSDISLKIALKK